MQGSKAMANIQLDNQNTILVGGFNPSEKTSIQMIMPNIWKEKYSKPPISIDLNIGTQVMCLPTQIMMVLALAL